MTMGNDNRTNAYQQLVALSEKQGYLLLDDLLNSSEQWSLPIQDVDWLSNIITTQGILIYDTAPDTSVIDIDDTYRDFAQIDYDEVYQRVIDNEPSLQNFINYIRNIKPPQAREMEQLKYLVKEGNRSARKRVFEMHLRFAVRIALNTVEQFGCEMADTLQDACIGLLYAVDRYDPDSGEPFGSYASLWIIQNVRRTQPTQRPTIYYPFHLKEKYFTVYPILKEYGYIGRDWSPDDIQEINGIIDDKLDSNDENNDFIIDQCIPVGSFEKQYDNFLKNIEECEKHESARDINIENCFYSKDPLEKVSEDALKEAIENALGTLTVREQFIIRGRYGLDDGEKKTLESLGLRLGVTRERIRQIENKALSKLRHPSRSRKLLPYYL